MATPTTTGQTVTTRIQHRRGTTAEWNANGASVILGRGEIGVEFYNNDNVLAGLEVGFKIGDGVTSWALLQYHRPDPGIHPNGRAQRDLSVFSSIGQATAFPRNFATLAEAVDALLHPYVPPTLSLNGTRQGNYEVGKVLDPITLAMHVDSMGSYPLVQKSIFKVSDSSIVVAEANGGAPLSNNDLVGSVNNLTLGVPGLVQYQGKATNSRPNTEGGNDTSYTNRVNYSFQYPVFYGYSNVDIYRTMTDGQIQNFILGGYSGNSVTNTNGITSLLAGKELTMVANPNNQYLVIAYPVSLGVLTFFKQYIGGAPFSDQFGNLLGPKQINFTQLPGSPTGGAWSNVPYYVYQKSDPTGNGTNVEYRSA